MRSAIRWAFIGILCVVFGCEKQTPPEAPQPPEIPVFVTRSQRTPIFLEFVGQIYGVKDIPIRARVEGFLEGIHFEEGARVKKGDLLYTIESRPFEAAAAAKMSSVAEAKTMLAKAASDLNRIRPLAERRAVSQSDLDAAVAQYEAARSALEAAEANLEASRIELSYSKIDSPISGIIGKTRAKVGEVVGREPNAVILNVVSRVDQVLVEFFITETQYLDHIKLFKSIAAQEQHKGPENERPQLILADGSVYPLRGAFEFIDREIDPATGSIRVQISFPNPDEILRPGQFAKVRVLDKVIENGIKIPQRCVMELQGLFSVFVVDKNDTIEQRDVTMGPKLGPYWLVTKGLKDSEQVVYEGLQKVRSGSVVKPTTISREAIEKGGK